MEETISIEVSIKFVEKGMCIHQGGFTLSDDAGVAAEYCTTAPGGLPYIKINRGKYKGKTFTIAGMQNLIEQYLIIE